MKDIMPGIEGYNVTEALFAGTVFFAVTGLVTGLIPNPLYIRKVPVTVLDYTFLLTTAVLASLYFGKEECAVLDTRIAGVGGILGFLAFGCPICNAFLLAFFSTSAIMTYFDPLRPFLGAISTLALIFMLYRDKDGF